MLYPENLEDKIGFDKIRNLLRERCLSGPGRTFVDKMRFSDDAGQVDKLVSQTEEFRQILASEEPFPASHYLDTSTILDKSRAEGAYLDTEEFYDLKRSLETILRIHEFFRRFPESYPLLHDLSGMVTLDKSLLKKIEEKIDEKGQLRNNASRELQNIRQRMQQEQVRARRLLDSMMRSARGEGYTPEDATLTVRGGRLVIPVLAEHKRRIKGFIHDESATGQTVYLEPAEVLEINNDIRDLEYQERREIIRILRALTDEVRPNIQPLKRAYHFLGMIDFIRAKAILAGDLEATRPESVKHTHVEWYGARHPLLFLAHQAAGKPVVPLHITLNKQQRIILISGPNAGGKSVTLKTVGLVQYMWQCGMLVPVDGHSKMGTFKSLFIDIGDEQSIENDLSTYSSHLTNMRKFLTLADKRSLFLIDEFGTGTEPQFGGAIAEAILEEMNQLKAYGVITTHYSNLKKYGEDHPGIVNAAMQFDLDDLEPLYELEIGKPGSSYALEIARKIGLPGPVLKKARTLVGIEQVRYDRLLNRLEEEKRKYNKLTKGAEKEKERLESSAREYESLREFLDEERKKIIQEAKADAKRLLKETNQRIENTIREIREQGAEKLKTRELRKELEEYGEEIAPEEAPRPKPKPKEEVQVIDGPINPGDYVRLKGQEVTGEVLALAGKDAEIRIGGLKSKVKLKRLEKISKRTFKKSTDRSSSPSKGLDLTEKRAHFKSDLDLRGKRGEEAMGELERFMDTALILGEREVRIVHGKGDGILKDLVRNQLRQQRHVQSVRDEHPERGGAGVTIVEMKD
ncbi:endonuclease MutS2 [Roseivirga sp. BDSF3-8]|uniref:endonuclease MutS2 n=1 Tax=Roseivirga sp. BDSF3-8 TaxID=3241598 RepID=UPI0035324738